MKHLLISLCIGLSGCAALSATPAYTNLVDTAPTIRIIPVELDKNFSREETSHAKSLVGSMIDPYCAIVYITQGTESKYGSKMIKRAVVRFVINKKTKEPAIFIERMYPFKYNNYGSIIIPKEVELIKQFLKDKTDNKFQIIYNETPKQYFIPTAKSVSSIKTERSYRDSKIRYSKFDKADVMYQIKRILK